MNIINIEHISKLFGDKLIFDDASFGLQEGDKVGIVGINGTGKSTLLRIVAGDETPDSGQIIRQNNLKMAYLPQTPEFPKDATVLSYALSGDEEDWQVQSNLVQLGITEYDAKIDTLSGGQRRKVALAKVLASDFDVLILDEPTNHLDNAMLSWLEDYLKNYRGTVFMVTHDRYFLDKVSNRILEISHGKMYSYDSNYSRFLELKAEREEMELASERKRQSILRMELEWAKRGCRARSTKQRARLERLEVLKNGTAPTADAVVEMDAVETRMGKKTIEFHNVSKAFGDKTLMKDFEYKSVMEVPHVEKVVINIGVGDAITNAKLLDEAVEELTAITGQAPVVTKAKKSIANFKLREGMPIGCKVTLRKEKMYEFLDKLFNISLPRVRDFRGVSDTSFDGRGNYTLGIKEQIIFPEIDFDKVDRTRGMDIVIVTSAKTNEEAKALLTQMGMPFKK